MGYQVSRRLVYVQSVNTRATLVGTYTLERSLQVLSCQRRLQKR